MFLKGLRSAVTASVVGLVALVASAAEHTKDSLDQVKKALADDKAVLIDVREVDEWKEGHLKDATNLPLSELSKALKSGEVAKKYPKTKIVYTHCAAGGRCLNAAEDLKKAGYDVRPLSQGYDELLRNGFPKAR